jgi:putative ABC transport system permease protein
MYTEMDAILFHPLAIPDLKHVVVLTEEASDKVQKPVAMANLEDWRQQSTSFSEIAAHTGNSVGLTGSGDPEHLEATLSTANLFHLLSVEPWLGRTFRPGEDTPGRDQEVVLGYAFWQRHFGGDRSVLNKTLTLDGRSYSIIGVMPQGFRYAPSTDVFLPLALTQAQTNDRDTRSYSVLARLRPGVTLGQAQAELQAIASHLALTHPKTNTGWTAHVQLLSDWITDEYTAMFMHLMMGAGLFVLLIICANVSNLQFSRSIARRSEIAIRSAMGAGRARIVRQLLTESVLLSLLGAGAGILVATLQLHISLVTMPPHLARLIPGWTNIHLNGRALAFSLVLAVAAGIIAGIAPTLSAMRVGVSEQLKAGGRSVSGNRKSHRLRNVFAVTQITLSVALVAGASLMATGMGSMLHVADRFSPQKLLVFDVNLPVARYATVQQRKDFYDHSLQAIRTLPGVTSAGLTQAFPYNGTGVAWQDLALEHVASVPGDNRTAEQLTVSPDYLASMHIPLLHGRSLSDSDQPSTTPVAVISQKLAQRYFADRDPIGQKIRMGKDADLTPWLTIVGVVDDVTLLWVDKGPQPAVYLSYTQFPPTSISYAIRSTGDALAIAPAVRRAVAGVDASLPLDNVESYATFLHEALFGLTSAVGMFAVDACIALLLSAIGIFGVMANAVGERTHEIGLRMALGAKPSQIRTMVLRRALILVAIGLGAGVPLAIALARMVASLLVGVDAGNPLIFGLTSLTVIMVALTATLLPAQRAASIEPMSALRSE